MKKMQMFMKQHESSLNVSDIDNQSIKKKDTATTENSKEGL